MRRPTKIRKKSSQRSFKKYAKKVNPKNRPSGRVMRGGFRL